MSAGVEGGDLLLPCHLSPLGHEQTELRGSMMRPMQHPQSTDVLAALSLSPFNVCTKQEMSKGSGVKHDVSTVFIQYLFPRTHLFLSIKQLQHLM